MANPIQTLIDGLSDDLRGGCRANTGCRLRAGLVRGPGTPIAGGTRHRGELRRVLARGS